MKTKSLRICRNTGFRRHSVLRVMYNCKQFNNFDVFPEQDAEMINPIASLSL